jgi:hypothetical protein
MLDCTVISLLAGYVTILTMVPPWLLQCVRLKDQSTGHAAMASHEGLREPIGTGCSASGELGIQPEIAMFQWEYAGNNQQITGI